MAVLSEYQTEKGYGAKTKGKGPVKSGKEYGKTLKQNKKEDASGPKVLVSKKPAAKKSTPAKKPTPKASTPKATPAAEKAAPMPSNPQYKNITMKPRKKRPGTGRTGEAAAKAANRKPVSKPKRKLRNRFERRK